MKDFKNSRSQSSEVFPTSKPTARKSTTSPLKTKPSFLSDKKDKNTVAGVFSSTVVDVADSVKKIEPGTSSCSIILDEATCSLSKVKESGLEKDMSEENKLIEKTNIHTTDAAFECKSLASSIENINEETSKTPIGISQAVPSSSVITTFSQDLEDISSDEFDLPSVGKNEELASDHEDDALTISAMVVEDEEPSDWEDREPPLEGELVENDEIEEPQNDNAPNLECVLLSSDDETSGKDNTVTKDCILSKIKNNETAKTSINKSRTPVVNVTDGDKILMHSDGSENEFLELERDSPLLDKQINKTLENVITVHERSDMNNEKSAALQESKDSPNELESRKVNNKLNKECVESTEKNIEGKEKCASINEECSEVNSNKKYVEGTGNEKVVEGDEEYAEGDEEYAEGDEEYAEGDEEYDEGNEEYDEGNEEYAKGNEEYAKGNEEYAKGNEEYVEGNEEYVEGNEEYVKGNEEYVEGNEEYVEGNEENVEGNEENVEGNEENVEGNEENVEGNEENVEGNEEYVEGIKEYGEGNEEYDEVNQDFVEDKEEHAQANEDDVEGNEEEYIEGDLEYVEGYEYTEDFSKHEKANNILVEEKDQKDLCSNEKLQHKDNDNKPVVQLAEENDTIKSWRHKSMTEEKNKKVVKKTDDKLADENKATLIEKDMDYETSDGIELLNEEDALCLEEGDELLDDEGKEKDPDLYKKTMEKLEEELVQEQGNEGKLVLVEEMNKHLEKMKDKPLEKEEDSLLKDAEDLLLELGGEELMETGGDELVEAGGDELMETRVDEFLEQKGNKLFKERDEHLLGGKELSEIKGTLLDEGVELPLEIGEIKPLVEDEVKLQGSQKSLKEREENIVEMVGGKPSVEVDKDLEDETHLLMEDGDEEWSGIDEYKAEDKLGSETAEKHECINETEKIGELCLENDEISLSTTTGMDIKVPSNNLIDKEENSTNILGSLLLGTKSFSQIEASTLENEPSTTNSEVILTTTSTLCQEATLNKSSVSGMTLLNEKSTRVVEPIDTQAQENNSNFLQESLIDVVSPIKETEISKAVVSTTGESSNCDPTSSTIVAPRYKESSDSNKYANHFDEINDNFSESTDDRLQLDISSEDECPDKELDDFGKPEREVVENGTEIVRSIENSTGEPIDMDDSTEINFVDNEVFNENKESAGSKKRGNDNFNLEVFVSDQTPLKKPKLGADDSDEFGPPPTLSRVPLSPKKITMEELEELLRRRIFAYVEECNKEKMMELAQRCEVLEKQVERWKKKATFLEEQVKDAEAEIEIYKKSVAATNKVANAATPSANVSSRPPTTTTSMNSSGRKSTTSQQMNNASNRNNSLPPPSQKKPDTPNKATSAVPLALIANTATTPTKGSKPVTAQKTPTKSATVIDLTEEEEDKTTTLAQSSAPTAPRTQNIPNNTNNNKELTSLAATLPPGTSLLQSNANSAQHQVPVTVSFQPIVSSGQLVTLPMLPGSSMPSMVQLLQSGAATITTSMYSGARVAGPLTSPNVRQPNFANQPGTQLAYLVQNGPGLPNQPGLQSINRQVLTLPTPAGLLHNPRTGQMPTILLMRNPVTNAASVPLSSGRYPTTQMPQLRPIPTSNVSILNNNSVVNTIPVGSSGLSISLTKPQAAVPPLAASVDHRNKPRPTSTLSQPSITIPTSSGTSLTTITNRHPAPLPPQPVYKSSPNMKLLPPRPALKISKVANGIVLSWNMTINPSFSEIVSYQLFAYQESSNAPSTSLWKKVGDVKALPLPMACTLTQFVEGNRYHFAVRAVDIHNRSGPYSEPTHIVLPPKK